MLQLNHYKLDAHKFDLYFLLYYYFTIILKNYYSNNFLISLIPSYITIIALEKLSSITRSMFTIKINSHRLAMRIQVNYHERIFLFFTYLQDTDVTTYFLNIYFFFVIMNDNQYYVCLTNVSCDICSKLNDTHSIFGASVE